MRLVLHARFLRALSQTSAIAVLGASVAACSNDVIRFEDALTTASTPTANQQAILSRGPVQPQAYPGDLPAQTANYAQQRPMPVAQNAAPARVAPPQTLAAPTAIVPAVGVSANNGARKPLATYSPPAASVAQTPHLAAPRALPPQMPAATQTAAARAKAPVILKPIRNTSGALRSVGADGMTTGSVPSASGVQSPVSTSQPSPTVPRQDGWAGAGGTWVTVRSGETLYNLSRRYGVPVDAIRKANAFGANQQLRSGSKIMIPAYRYSATSPVSAPDNDPMTRASSASSGYEGQPTNGRIATPKPRVEPTFSTARTKVATPETIVPAPAPSVRQVPSSGGQHVVSSGDTLYGIARKYSVKVSDLQAVNGLSGSSIRLGQKLVIPSDARGTSPANLPVTKPRQTASIRKADKRPTASISNPDNTAKRVIVKENQAIYSPPKASETGTKTASVGGGFRWPVNGRVIARFGDQVRGVANDGINISVPEGTPVKAVADGTVIYSGSELAEFGNLILVRHDGGWVSAYANGQANRVRRNDRVTRGQVIALSGRTGNAQRPQLHFELRKDSKPVDPLRYLAK